MYLLLSNKEHKKMSGKWITEHQIRLYMQSKQKGNTKRAAAQAAFSERSAYNNESQLFEVARYTNWSLD
jgi:hypothetical protein